MSRKPGLTMEQHRALGVPLHDLHNALASAVVALSHAYPLDGPILRDARRALAAVDALRSHLDDAMFREHPEEGTTRVYYPGRAAAQPDTDPEP